MSDFSYSRNKKIKPAYRENYGSFQGEKNTWEKGERQKDGNEKNSKRQKRLEPVNTGKHHV